MIWIKSVYYLTAIKWPQRVHAYPDDEHDNGRVSAMRETHKLWVVVADGKRAQAYQLARVERMPTPFRPPGAGPQRVLQPVPGAHWEAPEPDHAVRHRLGSVFALFAQVHDRALAEGASGHAKKHFIIDVAQRLKVALAQRACEELVLVMPSRLMGILRAELNGEANGKIFAVVPKDLVKCTPSELLKHLEDVLPPDLSPVPA